MTPAEPRQASGPPNPEALDPEALARELEGALEGEVRFDAAHRGLYTTDASNYRQVPVGVVYPRSREDVVQAVGACRRHGAPVLGRGGGTSLAGQCCNAAVVIDFTRHMNRVLEIDPERKLARVEPGCILDDLRDAAREHGLTFGPDPSTHDHCVLGGMIGNDACGVHSIQAAKHTGPRTSDNVHRLEVLTWDGARFWTGPTSEEELGRIVSEEGRRAEIHRGLRELRERYGDDVREGFPDIPRRVSGYNLDDLLEENGFHVARALAGSEGTCVLYLEAELHLVPDPPGSCLVVLGFHDVYEAADAVPRVREHEPDGLEGMDAVLIQYNDLKGMNQDRVGLLPEGDGFLLVQFKGDTKEDAVRKARKFRDAMEGEGDTSSEESRSGDEGPGRRAPVAKIYEEDEDEEAIWEIRESGLGATAFVPGLPDTWPGWEDSAVPPERLGDYLRDFRKLLDRHGYACAFYGHFGDGLLHTRIDFDLVSRSGIDDYLGFIEEAADLVASYGGSFSGEHGDGQSRGALLDRLYGPRVMEAFAQFKDLWDPERKMNPGKAAVDPYLPDEHLRLGSHWRPDDPETHFAFADDEGSFTRATMRCVGVGKCRRTSGGTMCPSYMVTHEEMHTTRGRARLLFEMMSGDEVGEVWKSPEVHEALDLCLSCKGCKNDCPVSVDMATYKAEFRAHWYEHHARPRQAWALGGIYWWSRLASKMPKLVNRAARTEPLASVLKWAGGIHQDRDIPLFSEKTFVERFREEGLRASGALGHPHGPGRGSGPPVGPGSGENGSRRTGGTGRERVIFWPDTFNNHLHADTALAGARALEALGYEVLLPGTPLCCGRPLYDFGFLERARKLFRQILEEMSGSIEEGVPVVGVEPSCVAAFRDELINLLPHDRNARRLSEQTLLFGEFLDQRADEIDLPEVGGRALLHGHCHQKAVLDFQADVRVLERMGVEVEVPDSGCCGMAGPFGFEKDHYEVSQACGERALLPAVRRAMERDSGVRIMTDGFSCREQILQNLGVRAENLAEVVWKGLAARAPVSAT